MSLSGLNQNRLTFGMFDELALEAHMKAQKVAREIERCNP
jgi:hypothetical protein